MVDNEPAGDSYPSPEQMANMGLPFYQQLTQHQHSEDVQHQSQHHGSISQSSDTEAHREVPDDPQLRANLTSMMGNFGNFGNIPSNMDSLASLTPPGMPHGSIPYGHGSGGSPDSMPSLQDKNKDKRTKVSRACDECRRKKIRCDANDDVGETNPCLNCTRTGAKCAFSRQPMKRGPSKGYIKELAERLNSLERQVHPPHLQQQHRHEIQQVQQAMAEGLQAYTPDGRIIIPDPRIGEKRSYEVAEALQQAQHPTNLSQSNLLPANGAMQIQQNHFAPAGAPQPPPSTGTQPFWRHGTRDSRHEGVGLSYEPDTTAGSSLGFDWDESVVDEYYAIIHQTFPLLPHSKNRLRQRLAECPASLQEAFLVAIDCLMRTFPTSKLQSNQNHAIAIKRAAELLARYPFENAGTHTEGTNLVYLQILLLMALESDNHGPAAMRGHAGPSRSEWLGRAAGVAGQLEINVFRVNVTRGSDRDSHDHLARRVWWVLFILDRWHASSTADLLKLPENSVVLLPDDIILLGDSTYHLVRLSFIVGHLAAILTTTKSPSTDVMAASNPASALLSLTLGGEIDRFRESVENVWGALNLVPLSYHHCHLLIKCLNPTTEPLELVGHAVKVATILNSRSTPLTPLNHQFGALAAMALCELCDVPRTRDEALRGLDQMIECLDGGRGLAGKVDSQGWDGAVRELVLRKREQMQQKLGEGLHHLADAAVRNGPGKFDATSLTRYGYLTSLGQGAFAKRTL